MHSCIGEGNGSPLQYPCLGNPTDRGAWWATVHAVTEGWARLSGSTTTRRRPPGFGGSLPGQFRSLTTRPSNAPCPAARPVCPQGLCGPAPPCTYPTFAALTLEMWTNGPEVDKTRQGLEVRGLGQDREGPRPRAMSGGGRVGGNDGGKPPEGLRSQHHS